MLFRMIILINKIKQTDIASFLLLKPLSISDIQFSYLAYLVMYCN